MKFTMEVKMDNAAFVDDPTELTRILQGVTDRVAAGFDEGFCVDINGNTVGRFEVSEG